MTTTALAIGSHTITAQYLTDGNFAGSTSQGLTQAVNKDSTATLVGSTPNPSIYSQSVTFTVRVQSCAGVPTGAVALTENGTPLDFPPGVTVTTGSPAAPGADSCVAFCSYRSQHTIATSSQSGTGTQYQWTSWSDGGTISHQLTAATSTTSYVASFATSYQLTTAAAPMTGGSVQPASASISLRERSSTFPRRQTAAMCSRAGRGLSRLGQAPVQRSR